MQVKRKTYRDHNSENQRKRMTEEICGCSPSPNDFEIRVLLRHYWKKGLSARSAADEIWRVEGEGTIWKSAGIKLFKGFKEGKFDIEDKNRSCRPPKLSEDDMCDGLEDDPGSSTRDFGVVLSVGKSTVHRHLEQLDFVHKKPGQDPHELTEEQACRRVKVCSQLLFYSIEWSVFGKGSLLRTKNGYTLWITIARNDGFNCARNHHLFHVVIVFGEKDMVWVWWNFEGILDFELVQNGGAINSELYCKQLDRV